MIKVFSYNPFEITSIHIGGALLIDLLLGDPRWFPHPVRLIGAMVKAIESIIRRINNGSQKLYALISGLVLVLIVVMVTFFVTSLISSYLLSQNSFLAFFIFVFLASTTIAAKGLLMAVTYIVGIVKEQDLIKARRALSHIVGRDTERLSYEEVLRADLETLAENLSDGVIAPLFYLTIGGLPLAMVYKAINTMDSMIGYKDERYRHLGCVAARLDDLANFLPARITAALIIISVFFFAFLKHISRFFRETILTKPKPLKRLFILFTVLIYDLFSSGLWYGIIWGFLHAKRAYHVTCIFRREHPSINSGYPISAMAGAVGVTLGGPARYRGVLVEKPLIGYSFRPMDTIAVEDGVDISVIAILLGSIIALAVKAI